MIHTDEDDEFARIEHEIEMKKGQPYYFQEHPTDPEKLVYRKPSRKVDDDDIQDYVRPWVGLTDEEVNTIYEQAEVLVHDSWVGNGTVGLMFPITLYKMLEAKLKEKNT